MENPKPSYYSCLFLVQKALGGWKPVINLSNLNVYITFTEFKMEMVFSVLGSIRKGDILLSIDLRFQLARIFDITFV